MPTIPFDSPPRPMTLDDLLDGRDAILIGDPADDEPLPPEDEAFDAPLPEDEDERIAW